MRGRGRGAAGSRGAGGVGRGYVPNYMRQRRMPGEVSAPHCACCGLRLMVYYIVIYDLHRCVVCDFRIDMIGRMMVIFDWDDLGKIKRPMDDANLVDIVARNRIYADTHLICHDAIPIALCIEKLRCYGCEFVIILWALLPEL